MNRFQERVTQGLFALVTAFGCWALYAQALVLSGATFRTLRAFSFVPLLVAAIALKRPSRTIAPSEPVLLEPQPPPQAPSLRQRAWLGVPVAIATLHVVFRSDWLSWVLATAFVTTEAWVRPKSALRQGLPAPAPLRLEPAVVLTLCAVAALLTAGSLKPNADDAYFMNVAHAVVEFPDAAPQSVDTMHRAGLPPVEQALHLPQVYELFVGLTAGVTGVSAATVYWVILPPLWAILGTLAHWLVLRTLTGPRQALWGTAAFVAVLALWGDGLQTFGNFGFVRLFQAKAVCIVVVLPLVVLAAFRYRQRPEWSTWLCLAATLCAAGGLTVNALVVGPLAALLALAAQPRFSLAFVRTTVIGATAAIPLLLVGVAWMYAPMAPYRSVLDIDPIRLGYATTLGAHRTPLVLCSLMLLSALANRARLRHAGWITGFVWLVVLFVFMPLMSVIGSHTLGHVYSWRLFWAAPVPLMVSMTAGVAMGAHGLQKWPSALLLIAAIVFAVSGPPAVSAQLWALANIGQPKVDARLYAAARDTVALARTDAPALVTEPVAVYVSTLPQMPPMVGVRAFYLFKLRTLVPDLDLTTRLALLAYADDATEKLSFADAVAAIDARGIATVVVPESHSDAARLEAALGGRGFAVHRAYGVVIAAKPR